MSKQRYKRNRGRRKQFRIRSARLRTLGFRSYLAYISSPLWLNRRRKFFGNHLRKCAVCDATEGPMILHHLFYDRLGEERDSDLVMLCDGCHKLAHSWKHFGPACVRLMRAAFEEHGDPFRTILEMNLREREQRINTARRRSGTPVRDLGPARIFNAKDLDEEARSRYPLTRSPSGTI